MYFLIGRTCKSQYGLVWIPGSWLNRVGRGGDTIINHLSMGMLGFQDWWCYICKYACHGNQNNCIEIIKTVLTLYAWKRPEMIQNKILLKWAVNFLWSRKKIIKTVWKIITTCLAICFPQWWIDLSKHALKVIMVVRIQYVNIAKVNIWAMWVPIKNTFFLLVGKQYFDIISAYSRGYADWSCGIDQLRSCNIRIITIIYLILIYWPYRCDCLS